MNKVLIGSVLACGLLLLDSPEAAAHEERGRHYRPPAYEYSDAYRRESHSRDYYSRDRHRGERYDTRHNRAKKMPKWLKRDRSFKRWFEHTRLRKNRRDTWNQLFDIYRWENSYSRYRRH
jgi:hypothetical protein